MRTRIRLLGALGVTAAVVLSGSIAGAHGDHSGETNAQRCDTYRVDGHGNTAGHGSSHHTSEFDNGKGTPAEPVVEAIAGTGLVYVHSHTGHYVVRNDNVYVEVVGGGGYRRDGNQGGYAQGEVDLGNGTPDVDFHANSFAGTRPPTAEDAAACLSVANNKIGDEGDPP